MNSLFSELAMYAVGGLLITVFVWAVCLLTKGDSGMAVMVKRLEWKRTLKTLHEANGIAGIRAHIELLQIDGVDSFVWFFSSQGVQFKGVCKTLASAMIDCSAAHAKLFEGWVIE